MTIISVNNFGGIIPRRNDDDLPDNCAVTCTNFDLTKRGLVPLLGVKTWSTTPVVTADANTTASLAQVQTACILFRGLGASWAEYASASPGRVVNAADVLRVAVFLPADEVTVAGQGCVDVHFTDGTFLGNVLDDQNIGSRDGNLTAKAQGKWYLRSIPLATAAGKTVSAIRLLMNYVGNDDHAAYFGHVYITGPGATFGNVVSVIADVDEAADPSTTSGADVLNAQQTMLASDEQVFTTCQVPGGTTINAADYFFVVNAPLSGPPKNKLILVRPFSPAKSETTIGISNYAIPGLSIDVQSSGWGSSNDRGNLGAWQSITPLSLFGAYSSGWISVPAPTTAMSLAVVGGTGPTVTRSYVYTRVSADGFESAPSAAVTASGNRDGTWQLTNITAWVGNDPYNDARNAPVKRIYRTPEGSATYKFVAEINAATTNVNDTAVDAVLGELIATSDYLEVPRLTGISEFTKGMIGGIVEETTIAFCEPYKYHAWPLAYRYSIPYAAVAIHPVGDRLVALTLGKPVLFSGTSPDALQWTALDQGEPCISAKASFSAAPGVVYPGRTSWGLINYGGYQPVTKDFIDETTYSSIVSAKTVAMFDGRKLFWITQGASAGYAFEFGANERSLTTFEVPETLWAMHHSQVSGTRWVAYMPANPGAGQRILFGKLASDTQRLKGTWKSKLHKTAKPVRFKVAQIRSNEWDTLSANMKAREAAYKTGGGGSPYSITITGLTQAEAWCYLKVWCEADKGADKVLVFDDFVVSDRPVRLARSMKSDCWQFEIRGNLHVGRVALAELERELNSE